ncbi:hypothetical protein ACS0TY_031865 [Phlomoides rotata]
MSDGSVECCAICCGLPLLLTIIIMTYLALKTYTPSCSITDLYIPALDTRLNSSATFIFFDLQLDNNIKSDGVGYEFMNPTLVFYYTASPVANFTLPRFSQGDDTTAHLRDLVETRGMPWFDAFAKVSGGSTAAFTVEFAAGVKVNRQVGRSRNKELLVRAVVEVNCFGEKVQKKDIKLHPFLQSISTTSLTSML